MVQCVPPCSALERITGADVERGGICLFVRGLWSSMRESWARMSLTCEAAGCSHSSSSLAAAAAAAAAAGTSGSTSESYTVQEQRGTDRVRQ